MRTNHLSEDRTSWIFSGRQTIGNGVSYTPGRKPSSYAQQHILDKKPHGKNLKKGDEAFESLCPLCAQNYIPRITSRP
jgi:hypothetical protein